MRLINVDASEAEPGGCPQGRYRKVTALVPVSGVGRKLILGETPRHVLKRALVLAQLEIHGRSLIFIDPGSQSGAGVLRGMADQMDHARRTDNTWRRALSTH